MPKAPSKPRPILIKRIAVAAISLVLMATALAVARRVGSSEEGEDSCFDCLAAMVAAARDGNVAAYLDCFAGRLRDDLAKDAKDTDAFAASLQSSVADLTGVASRDLTFAGSDRAQLTFERIYAEYNERQRVRLRRVDGRWKIDEMGEVRQFLPVVRYGTPAAPPVRSETEDVSSGNQVRETASQGQE